MSNENIVYIGVGRIRDQGILASSFDKLSNSEKNEIEATFSSYLLESANSFAPSAREKRYFGEGCMYLLADKDVACVYAVATRTSTYPERHAFSLLSDLIRLVGDYEDTSSLLNMERGTLTKTLKKELKDIMDKYDKPAKFDKTSEVRDKVESVKDIMQENVKKILASHANIESLEQRTDNLRSSAQQFQRNAVDLRRLMWWRNMKARIILAAVVIAVALYIIVPTAIYFTGTK